MTSRPLHAGVNSLRANHSPARGEPVRIDGEEAYRIVNYDRLRPFFMSLVSSSDHWLFLSSTGALTAGRRTPDLALFPYYTDDKIHDSAEITGGKTVLIIQRQRRRFLWEPFSSRYAGIYHVERNLYKSFGGNRIWFEEINRDLNLTFRYGWSFSQRFGIVRQARLHYFGRGRVAVRCLDGLQNILPAGVGSQLQLEKSTLVDAYKKSELLPETGLGLFLLSSLIVDRPEPAESLKANTVWSLGLDGGRVLLSSAQLEKFRAGEPVHPETDVRAGRGAYLVAAEFSLRAGEAKDWYFTADVDQDATQVAELNHLLRSPARLRQLLAKDVAQDAAELKRLVASADGLQKTAAPLGDARHFHNVLFNLMRGGVFRDGYQIDREDFHSFVGTANKAVAKKHATFFKRLKPGISYPELVQMARTHGDADLERLCREYLPLTFSRRHGDPSRPWNRFAIPGLNADGSRRLNYEGNWRDIFQNWEALAVSFPAFIPGMICKFANASTADGYNPYRINRAGIDWEVVDPADPWSHIGYWGDHQVIYLLKFLELLERHDPAALRDLLARNLFAYANVPYRIKPYPSLVRDAKHTVNFDEALDTLISGRVKTAGSDGRLIWDEHGQVRLVNLTEKLLVLVLAKFSNFIPEAGIWLNTQRPEWNDANNALVGNGVSMVTLYFLRRFLSFCDGLFAGQDGFSVSTEVADFFRATARILRADKTLLKKRMSDADRRRVLDALGGAGSRYRERIYRSGFSGGNAKINPGQLREFFSDALAWVDESLRQNQRADGLYHAYNLISLSQPKMATIRRLYEMLEGQVAVLSSGGLSAEQSLRVLLALKKSAIYRPDQHSYLLYPDRRLARFVEKNTFSAKTAARSRLLTRLVSDHNELLILRDVSQHYHFHGSIRNARDVSRILDELAGHGYAALVRRERALVLDLFEELFDHQSFTGRSGAFFGHEGLGCIYWHMVSKLLLAAQETFLRAMEAGAAPALLRQLKNCYYGIREGIGHHKPAEVYGAFPLDPYSHTPGQGGARQPGLTGQVKEDVLCRIGELGITVQNGCLAFRPLLLQRREFLARPAEFHYRDVSGKARRIKLAVNSLAFTYCQVPVTYHLAKKTGCEIILSNGSLTRQGDGCFDAETSRALFNRTGKIKAIRAHVNLK